MAPHNHIPIKQATKIELKKSDKILRAEKYMIKTLLGGGGVELIWNVDTYLKFE